MAFYNHNKHPIQSASEEGSLGPHFEGLVDWPQYWRHIMVQRVLE